MFASYCQLVHGDRRGRLFHFARTRLTSRLCAFQIRDVANLTYLFIDVLGAGMVASSHSAIPQNAPPTPPGAGAAPAAQAQSPAMAPSPEPASSSGSSSTPSDVRTRITHYTVSTAAPSAYPLVV